MREIAFRAWDKKRKKMVYFGEVGVVRSYDGDYKIAPRIDSVYGEDGIGFHDDYLSDYDFDNFILMQFTGLFDRNGKEVFEGDVVKNTRYDQLIAVFWQEGKYEDAKLEYSHTQNWLVLKPGFEFESIGKGSLKIFQQEDLEVIGNCYEQPELLNPKQ